MDFLSAIESWAERHGNHPAFVHREEKLTYRELKEQSDALAQWIIETLPSERTPIVVYGHMQCQMIVCFLACVKAGHAYIPVDDSIPLDRVGKIIRNSGAKLILAPGCFPSSVVEDEIIVLDNSIGSRVSLTEMLSLYAGKSPEPDRRVKPDENYYIIYTSGSTGEPKGVQITYSCLESFIQWMLSDFDLSERQVYLNQAPFSFDLSVMDLYPALVTGGTLFAIDKDMIGKTRELFEHLADSHLNIWTSTPSFVEICLMDKSFNQKLLPEMNTFLFCGEILPNRTVEKLLERFPGATIYNTYGPTETTVAVTSIVIDRDVISKYQSLPVGYCKSDCRIMILDEAKMPVPEGTKGEIVIVGPSVSPGYLNNPAITEKAFFEVTDPDVGVVRAYKTGDSGYLKDGLLFYIGRIDFQVKLHGYRIEIEDIEHHLRSLPMIKSAVVLPVYKEEKCEYISAFVVPESYPVANEFELTTAIKQELGALIPAYMVPRKILFREQIPMTNNGKVNRKELLSEVYA
jgi:D-alanine--poly(phosphoribitol) ligase subunit 1